LLSILYIKTVKEIQLFEQLAAALQGDLYFDQSAAHHTIRLAYSTDASVYQELPIAVAIPKQVADIQLLLSFARENGNYRPYCGIFWELLVNGISD